MIYAQMCGCALDGNDVTPFLSDEDAQFFGVYLGSPGEFAWQMDFMMKEQAMGYAKVLVSSGAADAISDRTFSCKEGMV